MITDEDLIDLPDDPEQAFVLIERKCRGTVQRELADAEHNQSSSDESIISYITHILGAANALNLHILDNWDVPHAGSENTYTTYRNFIGAVDRRTMQMRIQHARRTKKYSIRLDAAVKEKLRHYINKIKDTIDRLDVPEKKREHLYAKTNDLLDEIDRDRTKLDAYSALALELADTTNEVLEKTGPVRKIFGKISGLLGDAMRRQEDQKPLLPRPTPHRQLQAPEPVAPDSAPEQDGLDDDIPF